MILRIIINSRIMPNDIKEWLMKRGISEKVIQQSRIGWNGYRIVIPIIEENGSTLFNKYRKNPFLANDDPKYMYERGGSLTLYCPLGMDHKALFICEGELDCLALLSLGLNAVSSTGGARTFKREWADKFGDKDVLICLDNDEAGVMGALRIQEILPHAKWIAIPSEDGKDVTEFLQKQGFEEFMKLIGASTNYNFPLCPSMIPTDKIELHQIIGKLKTAVETLTMIQREDGRPHLAMIKAKLMERYKIYSKRRSAMDIVKNTTEGKLDLQDIKKVPIPSFIEFNMNGFAKCLWHTDSNASLFYNRPETKYSNTVHCFSCSRTWDVISVYMQLKGITFKQAISEMHKLL